ncbi:MAG: hypothetical protein HY246_05175 [Proteobacteria bacterium]|nr:hypothetical protein [Pseudomonadota bacterium]
MDFFISIGGHALDIGVALAVLLAVTSLTLRALERYANQKFFQVPLFFVMAKVLGLVLGAGLIYVQYQLRYYDFARLFVPESPWNITVWEFLADRTNPFAYGPIGLIGHIFAPSAAAPLVFLASFAVALGVTIVAAFRVWTPGEAWRGILQTLGFALWFSYVILFGVSLLFWLLFWLNIWALLVLVLVVQAMRHRV